MKKIIALLAVASIGFGVAAPAFAHEKVASDTTKLKTRKKPMVKKKTKDTTRKQL
ncbi:MAG: hypothetical protein JSU01_06940 [Bacteroidetes bacterium]|nr:hypothetical protein [Bacteroidota bacterium]